MVIYNAATRELTAKIVYYGPGLCGKTTNLKVLHDRLEPGTAGKLLNLQTQTDRTIYFDLLPVELGDIKGYKIRFQLATVPGQTAFNETRRVVLKGVDGIVFVADSQWTMLPKNLEAWQNLKDNLKSNDISFESIPVVVQYNKRDLGDILAVDAMQEALGLSSYPFVEAVASAGRGVTETFKLISKLTFVDLLRRLQGRRAEEASAAQASDEQARQDDLQAWKDTLLKRESQGAVAAPRVSRPLSLVPPVPDEAPFDTTELARGVDEEEPSSPYAVPEPPSLPSAAATSNKSTPATSSTPTAPSSEEAEFGNPAETMKMGAIGGDLLADASSGEDAVEPLSPADEIEVDIPPDRETVTDPAFLPHDVAREERVELLEQRLREVDDRAGRERETAERLDHTVSSVQEKIAGMAGELASVGERCHKMEHGVLGLQEAVSAFLQRLAPVEEATGRHGDIESGLRGLEAGHRDIDERLRAVTTRQHKDSDDVSMTLRGLTERAQIADQQMTALHEQVGAHAEALSGLRAVAEHLPRVEERMGAHDNLLAGLQPVADRLPQIEDQIGALRALSEKMPELEHQVESALRSHHELESTLDEKTQQGRREAEDIRSQIAPLLEDRVRRHESDALLFSEMERLRESLAESLHDLAERLRHAARK